MEQVHRLKVSPKGSWLFLAPSIEFLRVELLGSLNVSLSIARCGVQIVKCWIWLYYLTTVILYPGQGTYWSAQGHKNGVFKLNHINCFLSTCLQYPC